MEYRLRPSVSWSFFYKTTIIRLLKKKGMNQKSKKYKKIQTKTVGISYESLRVVVSGQIYVGFAYACMCYSYVGLFGLILLTINA